MGTQDPANPAWTHAQNAYICAWRDRGRGEDVRSGTPENTPHRNDPRSQGQWKGAVTMTVPRGALCGPVNRPSSVGVLTRGEGVPQSRPATGQTQRGTQRTVPHLTSSK